MYCTVKYLPCCWLSALMKRLPGCTILALNSWYIFLLSLTVKPGEGMQNLLLFIYLIFLNVLRTRFLFVNNFTLFLQFIFRDNLWFFSLRRHRVRIVNDYFSTCPHSQRLGGHSVSVVNDYVDTQFSKMSNYIFCNFFVIFFTFSKVK